ncbi:MAG: ATP-binding protein [Candidatus Theseobacter exili]|nr:ATP-binding protein [Candidatus Theseobacter exili]
MLEKEKLQNEKNGSAVTIQVPGKPCFLKAIRAFIRTVACLSDFSESNVQEMVLAVDEACSNIIRHSYNSMEGMIVIQCKVFDNKLEIYLRDFGKSATKGALRSRDIKDIKPGGLGCYLIRSVMDEIKYTGSDLDGNILKLVKRKTRKKEK